MRTTFILYNSRTTPFYSFSDFIFSSLDIQSADEQSPPQTTLVINIMQYFFFFFTIFIGKRLAFCCKYKIITKYFIIFLH